MPETPIRKVESKKRQAPAEWFEGHVEMEPILEVPATGLRQNRVHFHDGGHTRWHLHMGDQVLYFVEGHGMAEDADGNHLLCEPGDIVHVPVNTRHRHGAAPGSDAVHIAVTNGETIWDVDPRYPG